MLTFFIWIIVILGIAILVGLRFSRPFTMNVLNSTSTLIGAGIGAGICRISDYFTTNRNGLLESFDRLVLGFIVRVLPFLIVIYFILRYFATKTYETYYWEWETLDDLIFTFAFMAITIYFIKDWIVEVEVNKCSVWKERIFGWMFPMWPGSNWRNPFMSFFVMVDTQKHNTTTDSGTSEAKDDTMSWKYKTLWKVNEEDIIRRNANMRKYVRATEGNIDTDVKLSGTSRMNDWTFNQLSADAAKANSSQAITACVFDPQCVEYGIRIISTKLEDLDYSEETQNARKGKRKAQSVNDTIDELKKKKGRYSNEEAIKIGKGIHLPDTYQQIEVTGAEAKLFITPKSKKT